MTRHLESSSGGESDRSMSKERGNRKGFKPLRFDAISRGVQETHKAFSETEVRQPQLQNSQQGDTNYDYKSLHVQLEKYRWCPEELSNEVIKDIAKGIREGAREAAKKSYGYLRAYPDVSINKLNNKIKKSNNEYKRIFREYNKFSDEKRIYSKEDIKKIVEAVSNFQQAIVKLVNWTINFQDEMSNVRELPKNKSSQKVPKALNQELKDFVDSSPMYYLGTENNAVKPLFARNPYRIEIESSSTESDMEEERTSQERDQDLYQAKRIKQSLSDNKEAMDIPEHSNAENDQLTSEEELYDRGTYNSLNTQVTSQSSDIPNPDNLERTQGISFSSGHDKGKKVAHSSNDMVSFSEPQNLGVELGVHLRKLPLSFRAWKRRYNQQLYPSSDLNPERGILGPLNAKQRHSRKRA